MPEPAMSDRNDSGPVFATYLDARREAARRGRNECDGMVTRVMRTPYGEGYVLRSLPLELLAEPAMLAVTAAHRGSPYGVPGATR